MPGKLLAEKFAEFAAGSFVTLYWRAVTAINCACFAGHLREKTVNQFRRITICALALLVTPPASAVCNLKESWLNLSVAEKEYSLAHRNFTSILVNSTDLGNEEKLMAALMALQSSDISSEITHLGVLASIYAREKDPNDRSYISAFSKVATDGLISTSQTAVAYINGSITKLRNQSLIMQTMALRDSIEKVRSALATCTK